MNNFFYIDYDRLKKLNIDRPLRYFPPPPTDNGTTITYPNVNKDPELRKIVTYYFLKKSIKWINNYKDFNHLKKKLSLLKSNNGYKFIYNLLRKYVNENKVNWYDLKELHYEVIKDYLKYNIGK